MEAHGDAAALAFHGGDAQPLAEGFEDGVLQKVFHGRRWSAETVLQFLANFLLLFFGGDGGDFLVGAEAEVFAGDVILGDSNVEAQAERGTKLRRDLLALELGDGALQHLTVHVETDGFYVASAAEFEVEGGDSKAGAEFAELLHGREALSGDVGEHRLWRDEEIGIGALGGAADASAQLVEFGESEAVGAIDQDGVGARDVQAIFDDGGGDEDVGFIANELEHDTFELFLAHLAVGNHYARLRDEFGDHGAERIDRFDAIVNEKNLAFASEFGFDGALDEVFLEGRDDGLNGEAIARRRFDEGHIAKTDEGHVQRTRDWCGGKRQGVNVFAHSFRRSLWATPK